MLSIRTQDRMSLVPYDKRITIYTVISKNHKNEDVIKNECEINLGGFPLGAYATKKRSLEVLDEIQEAIKNVEGILLAQPLVTVSLFVPLLSSIAIEAMGNDDYEKMVLTQTETLNKQLSKTMKDIDNSLVYDMPSE